MRLVKRAEFLALPTGTVYQKYVPCVTTSDLMVKAGDCAPDDWFQADLTGIGVIDAHSSDDLMGCLELMEEDAMPMSSNFDQVGRDGFYGPPEGWFLVYEASDVANLITRLQEAWSCIR